MKDYNWVKNRFGTRMANILRGLRKEVFEISENNDAKFKDTEGREYNVLTTQALQTKGSETEQAFSTILANKSLIEVKWAELKDLRDNSELIPGSLYRITDYQCTTTQENTQSAGHQFDIVLLALSENKLAEEGWAMMNESNIYDVTFGDGVTKKCYLYFFNNNSDGNIVLAEDITKGCNLGIGSEDFINFDETNKTAAIGWPYHDNEGEEGFISIAEPNIPYNYFQNSNLSVWKVWYCLDNDKSRFAWADNASEESIIPSAQESSYIRDTNADVGGLYAWTNDDLGDSIYTKTTNPIVGDEIYDDEGTSMDDTIGFINGFGRGVIYRLIDEWNNDVCYDFKNILFARPLAGGEYTPNGGSEKFVYTFNATTTNNDCSDLTLHNGEEADDTICRCHDNVILPRINADGLGYRLNIVTFIVYHDAVDDEVIGICENNTLNNVYDFVGGSDIVGVSIYGSRFVFVTEGVYNSIILSAQGTKQTRLLLSGGAVIYINDKKVLVET